MRPPRRAVRALALWFEAPTDVHFIPNTDNKIPRKPSPIAAIINARHVCSTSKIKFYSDSNLKGDSKLYLEARWRKHCSFHNLYFRSAFVRIEPTDHQTWFLNVNITFSIEKIPFMLIKGSTTDRIFSPFWRCTGCYHSCPRKYSQYESQQLQPRCRHISLIFFPISISGFFLLVFVRFL